MKIIDDLIRRESSTYTNDPLDAGGPTKYGITLKTLSQYRGKPCTAADVEALTEDEAREIYASLYVTPFARFSTHTQLMELAVDSAVQHGVSRVQGWLHEIPSSDPDINFIELLRRRMKFYGEIVQSNPSQSRFIKGWLIRLGEFIR